jgi:hypothetical protein
MGGRRIKAVVALTECKGVVYSVIHRVVGRSEKAVRSRTSSTTITPSSAVAQMRAVASRLSYGSGVISVGEVLEQGA